MICEHLPRGTAGISSNEEEGVAVIQYHFFRNERKFDAESLPHTLVSMITLSTLRVFCSQGVRLTVTGFGSVDSVPVRLSAPSLVLRQKSSSTTLLDNRRRLNNSKVCTI
jgi:hypothetical protein